jgi:UDP-glucuronate decarboxylase
MGGSMRILVTGGAGFIGSHLCEYLLKQGHTVICVDSFYSGKKENLSSFLKNEDFELIKHDIRRPLAIDGPLDRIYNLACPASPVQYQFDPVLTIETSVLGVQNMLRLARRKNARFLQTSTSEVYGDPLEHPQKESYWGNVDPLGKRACYDEGKRAAEALCKDYHGQYGVDARIVRIFNTYGPRMMFNDGRVLSNFILQSLLGDDITVHGDGLQTRSFCYVDDLVRGLVMRMEVDSNDWKPVNLGNPDERTILDAAHAVKQKTGSHSRITHLSIEHDVPQRQGDPKQRCPDISRARTFLGWQPTVSFDVGLQKTIGDFKQRLQTKPHVLVFSPSYEPLEGPAERALKRVMEHLPGWEFDVITAKQTAAVEKETHAGRIHVYRLGTGSRFDKYLLPLRALMKARSLHAKHDYTIAWAIMASYGALAAALFSWFGGRRVPFLLSVYEGDINNTMLKRGTWLSPVYRFIFRRAHRWQVVGAMNEMQRAWLEDERNVQAVQLDGNWPLLAKKTQEMFQELEILSSRME